jgi:hypothetical protein
MNDIIFPGYFLLSFIFPILGVILLYFVIKFAVRNGVKEAHTGLIESVREIEKTVKELKED